MASLTEQHRDIYKLAIGMYAAAPGVLYLSELNAALTAGMTVRDVYSALANAPSFQLQHPGFGPQATNAQFADAFLDRVLGTEVTSQTRQVAFSFITDRLAGGLTRGDVMKLAMDALDAVSVSDPDFGAAARRLHNRIEAAREFTETLNGSSPDITFLQNTIATVTSDPATREVAMDRLRLDTTFVLTPGVDSGAAFTGGFGRDLFLAAVVNDSNDVLRQTLNSPDILDGGGGIDTLRAVINKEDVRPVLKNIENVELRFTGFRGVSLADASALQQVLIEQSSTAGIVSGLGAATTLTVRNQNQPVVFKGSDASALSVTLDHFGQTAVTDLVLGVELPLKAEQLALALNDAHVQLKAFGANLSRTDIDVSGTNTLVLAGAPPHPTTLTINGSGSLDLSGIFAENTAIRATKATGSLTVVATDNVTSVRMGSGADTVTYTDGVSAGALIDLGGGNDVLVLGGATGKGAVITGGPGQDTLKAANGAWLDADARTIYTGFEKLEVGGGQGTYVMSLLPQVKEVAVSDTEPAADIKILQAAPGTSLSFDSSFLPIRTTVVTFELADATGSNDTLHIDVTGIDRVTDGKVDGTVFANLVAQQIETLDVTSTIANQEGTDVVAYQHRLSVFAADSLRTIKVNGDARLHLSFDFMPATTLSMIDASASTGGIAVSAALSGPQPVTFIGSSARDGYEASEQGDVINAGGSGDNLMLAHHGGVDRLIYAAGDSLFSGASQERYDTVSNFVGTATSAAPADVIDLTAFGFNSTERSALDKGVLGAISDLSMPSQPDWFVTGGQAHAVAIATDVAVNAAQPSLISTYVFVDSNRNGDWDVSSDLFMLLWWTPDVSLDNFLF
jgi:hypothetical protein